MFKYGIIMKDDEGGCGFLTTSDENLTYQDLKVSVSV